MDVGVVGVGSSVGRGDGQGGGGGGVFDRWQVGSGGVGGGGGGVGGVGGVGGGGGGGSGRGGGISLEAGYVGGIWEDVGIFIGSVVGASRECPGREIVQAGRGHFHS